MIISLLLTGDRQIIDSDRSAGTFIVKRHFCFCLTSRFPSNHGTAQRGQEKGLLLKPYTMAGEKMTFLMDVE